jgi:hypothetical protein
LRKIPNWRALPVIFREHAAYYWAIYKEWRRGRDSNLRRLAGLSGAEARCRNPERSEGPHYRSGGEAGIRTLDTLSSMPVFKTGAINHSATSPFT